MLFKVSFSCAISIGEVSSVLGIRVDAPHLTNFDVGGASTWEATQCIGGFRGQGGHSPRRQKSPMPC